MNPSDLVRAAKESTREEFAKSHGGFFLVPAPRVVRARAHAATVPSSRAALLRQQTGALEEAEPVAPFKVAALRPRSETAPVHIGRTDENDVVIVDATVSRRHAAVVIAGERVEIVDLGSRNGTRVRGIQLRAGESQPIKSGDPVDIGSVHLVLVDAAGCWNALQEQK